MITLLPLIAMAVAILPGVILGKVGLELIKTGVLTFLLTSAATFYIRMYSDSILNKRFAKIIIIVSYLSSILLLTLIPEPDSLCFWMIGGLLVAMVIDQKLGLLLHFNLSFLLSLVITLRLETLIMVLLLGLLMCFLANALKQRSTAVYGIIIVLSTNVTLAFVMNNFFLDSGITYNYMNSLFSILAVMVISFLLSNLYERRIKSSMEEMFLSTDAASPGDTKTKEAAGMKSGLSQILTNETMVSAQSLPSGSATTKEDTDGPTEEEIKEVSAEEAESSNLKNIGTRTSYEVLCDYNNELLQKLKTHSESLFEHAVRISELSEKAAKEISADALLAKVGGLYHEIGKINGKNYIEEGLLIAEEYAFPAELKAILKEHNIKNDKPGSVEAAIVMLSDSVVSTIEYIAKTNDNRYTTNKIIDNIFQLRLDKGTFDSSKLSLKDFKVLKEFFLKEFQ